MSSSLDRGASEPLRDPPPATGAPSTAGGVLTYQEVEASPDFAALRRSFRSFIFPLTALFLAWYFLFVLLAAYAPGFMATRVVGNINVGLLLGLGQFVSTFVITLVYRRWADRRLDPEAARLRAQIEGVDR